LQNIVVDHSNCGISRDQTYTWGIEWDLYAPELLGRKIATAQVPDSNVGRQRRPTLTLQAMGSSVGAPY